MYDETDRHQPIAEMVEERAAAGLVVERPAHRVLNEPGLVLRFRHLPQLFQADAEFLRPRLGIEAELPDEHFRQRAARTFGEERVLAAKFDAARKTVLVTAGAG